MMPESPETPTTTTLPLAEVIARPSEAVSPVYGGIPVRLAAQAAEQATPNTAQPTSLNHLPLP